MKKKSDHSTTAQKTPRLRDAEVNNTEQTQTTQPRHPDADFVQKTHFGYQGAYA